VKVPAWRALPGQHKGMNWWQRLLRHEPADAEGSVPSPLKTFGTLSSPPSFPAEPAPAEPVILQITDELDLHTFSPRDVEEVVEAYLEEAHAQGFTQVRIIHGKGIGVQRERVRAILRRTPWVVHYEEAPPEAGSWGATLAWLRPHDV